jgi:hypothetical protein
MRCHPGPSFIPIFYKHIRLSIAQLQVCIKVGISLSPKDITLGLMETKRWRFILCNKQRHYGWCLLNLGCRKTRRLRLRRDRRYISIEQYYEGPNTRHGSKPLYKAHSTSFTLKFCCQFLTQPLLFSGLCPVLPHKLLSKTRAIHATHLRCTPPQNLYLDT